jgi:hypothetical protein
MMLLGLAGFGYAAVHRSAKDRTRSPSERSIERIASNRAAAAGRALFFRGAPRFAGTRHSGVARIGQTTREAALVDQLHRRCLP